MEIRLATFNLENLGIRDGEETPENQARLPQHLEALRQVLRRIDADAVAFQELLDPNLLDSLLDGMDYPHFVLGDRGSSPLQIGVFSRYPLTEPRPVAAGIVFSRTDPKTGLETTVHGSFSRPALQVRWDVPGFETTLLAVHWKSKIPSSTPARLDGTGDRWARLGDVGEGRMITEMKRLGQAVELRKVVDRLIESDPGSRVIVLGDFNDSLDSEGLRIVAGDARAAASPGLATGELVACELSVPRDLRFSQIYRGRKELLDHVLISRGLVSYFQDARIYNEVLRPADEDPGAAPCAVGSDHAPFVVTFRI